MVNRYIYLGMSAVLVLTGCTGPRVTVLPAPRPLGEDIQSFHTSSGDMKKSAPAKALEPQDVGGGVIALAGIVIVAIIYLRALGRTGQTWGRRIVGVKVIDASTGAPIGVWRALGRQLFAGTISSWLFYLGFWCMLWDPESQTWHDKAVNSVAVRL